MNYRFHFRIVDNHMSPQVNPPWDRAVGVDVLAESRESAVTELLRVMGDPPNYRRWVYVLDGIGVER